MSGLQDKASPVHGLTSVLAYELGELRKAQFNTNKLLGDICNYKEEQKQGDIKHRKLTGKQNKISLLLHLVSISIASAAFYISIAGLPVFISVWVKGVL